MSLSRDIAVHFIVSQVKAIRAVQKLCCLLFLGSTVGANAAQIEATPIDSTGQMLITITGELSPSDIDEFRTKTAGVPKAIVALQSDGGSLLAGIRIGTLIRMKNFYTLVPDGVRCASACAIAWLAIEPPARA
jgi:hypothetical protein